LAFDPVSQAKIPRQKNYLSYKPDVDYLIIEKSEIFMTHAEFRLEPCAIV
jgi:hypothetical protein